MNAYEVKVTTKLGSEYENTIIAESEEDAIARTKKKYPLQEKILIVSERVATESEAYHRNTPSVRPGPAMNPERLQKSSYEEGKAMMWRGAMIGVVGLITTVLAWIAGWIVLWFCLALGYGIVDFLRGYAMWKNNKPSGGSGFQSGETNADSMRMRQ